MYIYCIAVRTGMEEKYMNAVQPVLNDPESTIHGTIHFLRKRMRLKTGKEYFEPFFPGYLFLETEEQNPQKLRSLSSFSGFLRFLPSSSDIKPLVTNDLQIITSLLKFGTTVDIVPVMFNEQDRIVILGGPFKDFSGKVIAVNKRNKRLNIQLDFLNGMKVVGLTYEEVAKLPESMIMAQSEALQEGLNVQEQTGTEH